MRTAKAIAVLLAASALIYTVYRGPVEERVPAAPLVHPAGFEPTPLPADFTGNDLQGAPFAGSQLRGKVVLLDFWAVWCAPCIDAVPKLNRLQAELGGDDFEVIGYAVHSGSAQDVEAFALEHGIEYRVVIGDNDLSYEFGVIGYPSYFLIDREGRQVRKYVGALPGLEDRVIADVHALLGPTQ